MKNIMYGIIVWLVMVNAALAQEGPPCANRAEFLKHLDTNYKESPVAMGLTANGGLLEVIASESGSWTIIVTTPNGLSCGVASGIGWEDGLISKDKGPAA